MDCAPELSQYIVDALAEMWHKDGVVPAPPEVAQSLLNGFHHSGNLWAY